MDRALNVLTPVKKAPVGLGALTQSMKLAALYAIPQLPVAKLSEKAVEEMWN